MKLANVDGRAHAVDARGVLDLQAASRGDLPDDPMAYLSPDLRERAGGVVARATDREFRRVAPQAFGPPVPRPRSILAVALNYRAHAAEAQRDLPGEPAVFPKLTSSLCGPFDDVEVPAGCPMIDYEAEVVVVVGRRMRDVAAADVWAHVAGITAGQDISDRVEQRRPPLGQFALAKSYDTFSPTGPTLVTLDELPDLDRISIRGRIDGQDVQQGTTDLLIHPIPHLLAWCCRYVTLEPGDLIFTGTPAGVGSRRDPPLFLTDGMVIETEIPEVGVMRNTVRAVPAPRSDALDPMMEATS